MVAMNPLAIRLSRRRGAASEQSTDETTSSATKAEAQRLTALVRGHKKQKLTPRGSPVLTDLPTEIFLEMVPYAATQDMVCLSLCNKDLYRRLGRTSRIVGNLFRDDDAKERLLERLAQDMYIVTEVADLTRNPLTLCEACLILHSVPYPVSGGIEDELNSTRTRRTLNPEKRRKRCQRRCIADPDILHNQFGFGHVRVLGQLFRADAIDQLHQYIDRMTVQKRGQSVGYRTAFDFRAAVRDDGNVYIRKQEWILIDKDDISLPWEHLQDGMQVCAHVKWSKFHGQNDNDIDTIERALKHLKVCGDLPSWGFARFTMANEEKTWAHQPLQQCEHCPSEYRLDFGAVSESDMAVVLTIWMCLGEGKSMVEGVFPKIFTGGADSWGYLRDEDRPKKYEFVPGSVVQAFQGHTSHDDRSYKPEWNDSLQQACSAGLDIYEVSTRDYKQQFENIYDKLGWKRDTQAFSLTRSSSASTSTRDGFSVIGSASADHQSQ
ncbi:hypothetical protein PMZ80_008222 [Knufia obscura]|uniref:F-box domain-containing protein n=1 Tax=Knufia obscura TaxID=1635080 RepID=A0ABR0RGY4_9EURO|nr:hypothetical protein PMZ80_008222 [Knufia obscura]